MLVQILYFNWEAICKRELQLQCIKAIVCRAYTSRSRTGFAKQFSVILPDLFSFWLCSCEFFSFRWIIFFLGGHVIIYLFEQLGRRKHHLSFLLLWYISRSDFVINLLRFDLSLQQWLVNLLTSLFEHIFITELDSLLWLNRVLASTVLSCKKRERLNALIQTWWLSHSLDSNLDSFYNCPYCWWRYLNLKLFILIGVLVQILGIAYCHYWKGQLAPVLFN